MYILIVWSENKARMPPSCNHNRNPVPPTAFSWIPVPLASDEREIETRAQFHFGMALAVHLEVLVGYLT
jgi:hypothetical protein